MQLLVCGNELVEMLQQLPTATYDVVGTTEAEAGPAIAAAAPIVRLTRYVRSGSRATWSTIPVPSHHTSSA